MRLIKTLIHKDRLSDDEGRAAIRARRPADARPVPHADPLGAGLLSDELRPLSRSDFLPGAEEAARSG